MRKIPTGNWGGPHINISMDSKAATIEYDCGNGTIQGPLVVDSKGRFKLSGTYTFERGGPIRADEAPNRHPASYTGVIKGNSMTLTVSLTDSDMTVGTYSLIHGKHGRIFKCL